MARPSRDLQEETILTVQREIKDAMHNTSVKGTHKAFICKADLDRIWLSSINIRSIFRSSPEWNDNDLDNIRKNFVKIISILTTIHSAKIDQFRELFYTFKGDERTRTDQDLPFAEEETAFLGTGQIQFLENQYAFLPVIIEESDESQTQEVQPQYRLPFMEEGQLALGCGGFGTVFKVVVAARHLRTRKGDETHFNEEVRTLACKRFQTDHSGEDFKREVANLCLLKESLATRKHIMLHVTTIVHGADFNILLPIAKHGNLEVFLNRGLDKENGSAKAQNVYDFDKTFPRFRDPSRHQSILGEMHALADALLWLHKDLNILNDPNLCCAHMDLKPSNILIDSSPNKWFGKWMITDFGISVFRHVPLAEEDDEKEDMTNVGVETVGDLGARLEPKTATIKTKQQHEGTYQAPEAYRLGVKKVGRKSDIWSFGCVLSEVLAFALGAEDLLKEFRIVRLRGFKNDYFYNETKVTVDGEGNRFLGGPNITFAYGYKPKYAIHDWLSDLPRRYPEQGHWLQVCVDLVKSTLEIETKPRTGAVTLKKTLRRALEGFHTPPLPGRMVPSRPPPAVPQQSNGLGIQGLQNGQSPPRPPVPTFGADPTPSVLVSDADSTQFPPVVGPQGSSDDRHARNMSLGSDSDQFGVSTPQGQHITPRPSRPRLMELQSSGTSPDRQSSESGAQNHRYQPQSPQSSGSSMTSPGSKSVRCNLSGGRASSHSLSPDGLYAAFLYPNCIYVFLVNTGEHLKTVFLTSDENWKTLRISGSYLVVSGIKARKKTFILRDWEKPEKAIDLPTKIKPNTISNVIVSRKGLYGFVSARNIILMDIHTGTTHELVAENGYKINEAAFGSNGSWLCAWAFGPNRDYPSQSYNWNVKTWPSDEPSVFNMLRSDYEMKDHSVPKILLLPFQSLPSSIICKDDSIYFIADGTKTSVTTKNTTINGVLISCVLHDDSLICVFKTQAFFNRAKLELRSYRIIESSGGTHSIDSGPSPFARMQGDIDSSTQIATLAHDTTVILCNVRGEVEIVNKTP